MIKHLIYISIGIESGNFSRVSTLINVSGPDGIYGKMLKNCSESLAYPLSLIFKISYNTGSLSKE